jgi:hypothetical protein
MVNSNNVSFRFFQEKSKILACKLKKDIANIWRLLFRIDASDIYLSKKFHFSVQKSHFAKIEILNEVS